MQPFLPRPIYYVFPVCCDWCPVRRKGSLGPLPVRLRRQIRLLSRTHNSNPPEIQTSTRARGSSDRMGSASIAGASNPSSLMFYSILEEVKAGLIGPHLGFSPLQILNRFPLPSLSRLVTSQPWLRSHQFGSITISLKHAICSGE